MAINKMTQDSSELFFLGTGAADWPTDGSCCGIASRSFASAVLDGRILIDCTLQGLNQMAVFAVDPNRLTDVFITHGHPDHYRPEALIRLAALRCGAGNPEPLRIHLDRQLADSLAARLTAESTADPAFDWSGKLSICPLTAYEPADAGSGCIVTPLPANHEGILPGEMPFSFLIRNPFVSFLYATDGAWLPLPVWRYLQKLAQQLQLDAWVTNCTIGDGHRGDCRIFEHNSLEMVRIMADTLFAQKILKPGALVILTHLARTLHPTQAELEQTIQLPYQVAFDGCRLYLPGDAQSLGSHPLGGIQG